MPHFDLPLDLPHAGRVASRIVRLLERHCEEHGIDADEAGPQKLRAEGLSAEAGRAEALPFGDASFDLVTFSYTTHHLADLPRALAEALRVARTAVLILEGWYDGAVPSQVIADRVRCLVVFLAASGVANLCQRP